MSSSYSFSPPLQINCWQHHFGTHPPWFQVAALILPALVSAAQCVRPQSKTFTSDKGCIWSLSFVPVSDAKGLGVIKRTRGAG